MTVSKNTLIGIPIGVNNRLSLPEVEFSSYKMQNKKKNDNQKKQGNSKNWNIENLIKKIA